MLFSRLLRRDSCGDVDAPERIDQLECLLDVTAILSRPEPTERTLNDALDSLVRRTRVRRASLREPDKEGVLLALDAAGEGLMGKSLDGRTTFANPAGCRIPGYREEELIDQPGHALLHHSLVPGVPTRRRGAASPLR